MRDELLRGEEFELARLEEGLGPVHLSLREGALAPKPSTLA
jgi:hypothetical protein